MSMTAKLIQVGNSKGIRIPKPIIEQMGLSDEVELVIENNELIIRPLMKSRQGWEQAFAAQAEASGALESEWDASLLANDWDETEWTW